MGKYDTLEALSSIGGWRQAKDLSPSFDINLGTIQRHLRGLSLDGLVDRRLKMIEGRAPATEYKAKRV